MHSKRCAIIVSTLSAFLFAQVFLFLYRHVLWEYFMSLIGQQIDDDFTLFLISCIPIVVAPAIWCAGMVYGIMVRSINTVWYGIGASTYTAAVFLCILLKTRTNVNPALGININPLGILQELQAGSLTPLFNCILFIPIGFFAGSLAKRSYLYATIIAIIGVELAQLIFRIGVCDISDMLTNSLGTICGWLLYGVLARGISLRRNGKHISIHSKHTARHGR